jgi:hypothetical protein
MTLPLQLDLRIKWKAALFHITMPGGLEEERELIP